MVVAWKELLGTMKFDSGQPVWPVAAQPIQPTINMLAESGGNANKHVVDDLPKRTAGCGIALQQSCDLAQSQRFFFAKS